MKRFLGTLFVTALLAPAAHAAPLAAPGAPMHSMTLPHTTTVKLDGKNYHIDPIHDSFLCSQGPAGLVNLPGGKLRHIMLTAGHCVQEFPGDRPMDPVIYVNTHSGGVQPLGRRDKAGFANETSDTAPLHVVVNDVLNSADWGTVALNPGTESTRVSTSRNEFGGPASRPVHLTRIKDSRTLGPYEVSVDNFGQPICKDGARTGRSCGTQLARTKHAIWSFGLTYKQGDSGGINFDPRTGEVLGMTSQGLGPIGRAEPADVALEQAYAIPDGQVNQRFHLSESTAAPADFKTAADETRDLDAQLSTQGLQRQTYDFHAEFNAEAARAQATATQAANDLQAAAARGDVGGFVATANDAATQAASHAENLAILGGIAALEDFGRFQTAGQTNLHN